MGARGSELYVKYTPALAHEVVKSVRLGVPVSTACRANGLSTATLARWLERAVRYEEKRDSRDQVYWQFAQEMDKARAQAEAMLVIELRTKKSLIRGEGGESVDFDSESNRWMLLHGFKESWGKNDQTKIELTGKGGGAVKTEIAVGVVVLPPEEPEK